jgi:uncharacterized protein YgiM (DUF1202 family)
VKDYHVTTEHRASYPYLVELKVGEKVKVTGKEENGWVWCVCKDGLGAWVPEGYLARKGDEGISLFEYSSAELNATVSEKLSCDKEANGWLWCVNEKGERGWVPKNKLKRHEGLVQK